MIIHQAYFGDKNLSHNLILSSIDDRKLIGTLKLYSDIPPSVDIDYLYLSGGKVGDYYVFTRTMKDEKAKRGGMSFSHSLIIPFREIEQLENLSCLFECFVSEPKKEEKELLPIDFNGDETVVESVPSGYVALVESLIKNDKTVIYLGYDNFENIISFLWQRLPKKLKENLSFTISGSPNEINDKNYTLIHTPLNCENKWNNFQMIKPTSSVTNENNLALTFLTKSDDSNAQSLNQFIEDNEINFTKINELGDIVKCYQLIQKSEIEPDIITLKRIINNISKLIPNEEKGQRLKKQILNSFVECIASTDLIGFKVLRNIDLKSFENGVNQVKSAALKWVNNNIILKSKYSLQEITTLITEAFFGQAETWWNEIIKNQFQEICSNVDMVSAKFIWGIWEHENRLITESKTLINDNTENYFFKNFPSNTNESLLKKISTFSITKKWFSLHALLVANYLEVGKAILAQVKIDNTESLSKNLNTILQSVDEASFVTASTQIDNQTLHKLVGKLCSESPHYLSSLDIVNPNWQAIWYQTFLKNNNIVKGIVKPQEKFHQLLNLLIEKESAMKELVISLSVEFDNIFDFPKRKEVWKELDSTSKVNLMKGTSLYVFKNFEQIDWSDLEAEISTNLKSSNFIKEEVIKDNTESVIHKLKFLEKIGKLTEHQLISILNFSSKINLLDAKFISKIIRQKNWKKALGFALENKSHRNNLGHIVSECKSMLSMWDRFFVSDTSVPVKIDSILREIDEGRLHKVFEKLDRLGLGGSQYERLKEEYIAGTKGIDLIDLQGRLKTYIKGFESK